MAAARYLQHTPFRSMTSMPHDCSSGVRCQGRGIRSPAWIACQYAAQPLKALGSLAHSSKIHAMYKAPDLSQP